MYFILFEDSVHQFEFELRNFEMSKQWISNNFQLAYWQGAVRQN